MAKLAKQAYADDFVIGATYETWGGKIITIKRFRDGVFWWQDDKGDIGSATVRALASRVRREINS